MVGVCWAKDKTWVINPVAIKANFINISMIYTAAKIPLHFQA
jgi:hypothetical protein